MAAWGALPTQSWRVHSYTSLPQKQQDPWLRRRHRQRRKDVRDEAVHVARVHLDMTGGVRAARVHQRLRSRDKQLSGYKLVLVTHATHAVTVSQAREHPRSRSHTKNVSGRKTALSVRRGAVKEEPASSGQCRK